MPGAGANPPRTIFLSSCEPSGDLHGAGLARELLRADPSLRLTGLGGPRMAEAGVRLVAGLDRLAVMGVTEVVRKLPGIWSLRRRVRRRLLRRDGVDLFVPIDSPAFNLSLAVAARRRGVPVLYYIVPQVWAWREGRARRLAAACDRACTVLPFEEPLLRRYGVEAHFVGHPLLDGGCAEIGPDADPLRGDDDAPVLALFPGSRRQEVARMLPLFADAARRVRACRPETRFVVASAPGVSPALYGRDPIGPSVPAEAAVAAASAALTKSGTITLQLALARVPMVVGHRVSPITYRLARHLVRVDHVALANLVAGKRVVPELIQREATPQALAEAVLPFLEPGSPPRRRMREALGTVRPRLGTPGAARRVAGHALSLLGERA